jgi:hypothetical protein
MNGFVQAALAMTLLLGAAGAAAPQPAERPVPRTHAHNDYEHPHPLFDALHEGFVGVEADVYLVGTELRVAHDKVKDWSSVPTLEASYLEPLRELKAGRNGGGIYPDGTPVLLLVDIKTEAVATYQRVHKVLAAYQAKAPGLFTTYTRSPGGTYQVTRGAVTVVISGNRPRAAMAGQDMRYAGYDGRPADIGPDVRPEDSPAFVTLISENWDVVFTGPAKWNGNGEMPEATRAKLKGMVEAVHAEGKMLRFWRLPVDGPAVWGPLYDAGVDLINTDDLKGLAAYVKSRAAEKAHAPRSGDDRGSAQRQG